MRTSVPVSAQAECAPAHSTTGSSPGSPRSAVRNRDCRSPCGAPAWAMMRHRGDSVKTRWPPRAASKRELRMGVLDDDGIVSGADDGNAEVNRQRGKQRADDDRVRLVQMRGRLVGEDHRGRGCDRPRERTRWRSPAERLAASSELRGVKPTCSSAGSATGSRFVRRDASQRERPLDVLPRRQERDQVGLLGDVRDPLPPETRSLVAVQRPSDTPHTSISPSLGGSRPASRQAGSSCRSPTGRSRRSAHRRGIGVEPGDRGRRDATPPVRLAECPNERTTGAPRRCRSRGAVRESALDRGSVADRIEHDPAVVHVGLGMAP